MATRKSKKSAPEAEVNEMATATEEKSDPVTTFLFSLLSDSEQQELKEAMQATGQTAKEIAARGFIKEIRTTKSNATRFNLQELSDNDLLNLRGVAGVGAERIRRGVERIKAYNETATDPADRIPVTQANIRNLTNVFANTIKDYMKEHQKEIDDLNMKYKEGDLTNPGGNRRGFDIRATLAGY